jgi:hypothetical protein
MTFWKFWQGKKTDFPNIYHADFVDKVEPADDDKGKQFTVEGVKYWRFKKDTIMPWGRYMMLQTFERQVELGINRKLLEKYIQVIEENISGEKGTINLTNVHKMVTNIKSRIALAFTSDTVYDYASAVYFDETENLNEYNMAHNKEKIARWREAGAIDFFYMRPVSELLNLKDISPTDLTDFIRVQGELLRGLDESSLDMPPA